MILIGQNDDLIDALSYKRTILDGRLSRLDIFEDDNRELVIEATIHLLYTKVDSKIKIRFQKIENYSFYYTKGNSFYFIERFKFFNAGNNYYLSLDPCDEKDEINPDDQDFICCKFIQGYIID